MNILNDITTICMLIQAIVILVTAPFFFWQLVELKRATMAGALANAFEYLQDKEVRKGRKLLRNFSEKDELDKWTDDEFLLVEVACNAFDRVGIMITNGVIPGKIIAKNYRDSIIDCWENSKPLRILNREKRRPDYWDNFENLYNLAKKSKV